MQVNHDEQQVVISIHVFNRLWQGAECGLSEKHQKGIAKHIGKYNPALKTDNPDTTSRDQILTYRETRQFFRKYQGRVVHIHHHDLLWPVRLTAVDVRSPTMIQCREIHDPYVERSGRRFWFMRSEIITEIPKHWQLVPPTKGREGCYAKLPDILIRENLYVDSYIAR